MKRPLTWSLLFYSLGIVSGYGAVSLFFVMPFICCLVYFFWRKKWDLRVTAVFLCLFLLGFGLVKQKLSFPDPYIETLAKTQEEVLCTGVVSDVLEKNTSNWVRIRLQSTNIQGTDADVRKTSCSLLIYMDKMKNLPQKGDVLQLSGKLDKFAKEKFPGGFSEDFYYRTRGYDYKFKATEMVSWEKNEKSYPLVAFRGKIQSVFDQVLSPEESGILKAMLTGDGGDISDETRELYNKGGISHVLAISGLHISMIGLFVFTFLRNILGQRKQTASYITMGILLGYLFFVGASPSALRAVTMVILVLVGNLCNRWSDRLQTIAGAALILLLIQPLYLFDVGFQLSFCAVLGIFLGGEAFVRKRKYCSTAVNSFLYSFFASIWTFPIVAYYFYTISIMGVFVNLLVLPLMGILLGLGAFMGILGCFTLSGAAFVSLGVHMILQFYNTVCTLAGNLPGSELLIGRPPLIAMILFYCLLILFFTKIGDIIPRRRIFEGALFCCLFFSLTANRLFFKKDQVVFLDVGQGDANVILTHDKRAYLIDGGGSFGVEQGKNVGATVVVPFLKQQGIQEVEGVFFTHFDRDHILGLLEVLEMVPTKAIYLSDYPFEPSELYDRLMSMAEETQIPVFTLKYGDTAVLSEDLTLDCLYPIGGAVSTKNDDNHGSLVLFLKRKDISVLFMGDAGISDEKEILNHTEPSATVLKVGHHGSKYSSGQEFLKAVSPEYGIFSYGVNNIYGHPNIQVINDLKSIGCTTIETGKVGSIFLSTDGITYTIQATREE